MNETISPACCVEEGTLQELKHTMPPAEAFGRSAACFKILSDENRCRIIYALSLSELCVCHLAELLGASQSSVSHQLSKLKLMGLVKARKSGKEVYYSLYDDHFRDLLMHVLEHEER